MPQQQYNRYGMYVNEGRLSRSPEHGGEVADEDLLPAVGRRTRGPVLEVRHTHVHHHRPAPDAGEVAVVAALVGALAAAAHQLVAGDVGRDGVRGAPGPRL